jgi:hypothetical protein
VVDKIQGKILKNIGAHRRIVLINVKVFRYKPGMALRVPGG